jgi:MYXO-CTERM domain-containing protein
MKRIFVPIIGLAAALALVTPAEAADNGVAAPTSTVVVAGPATTQPHVDTNDDDDDSDKTGLWGLLGLLGLAGLAGLKRKRDDNYSSTRPVTGTAPPRADGATSR